MTVRQAGELARNAIGLLSLAGEPVNPRTIARLIRSAPDSWWRVDGDRKWREESYFYRCWSAAYERADDDGRINEIGEYFVWEFPDLWFPGKG